MVRPLAAIKTDVADMIDYRERFAFDTTSPRFLYANQSVRLLLDEQAACEAAGDPNGEPEADEMEADYRAELDAAQDAYELAEMRAEVEMEGRMSAFYS